MARDARNNTINTCLIKYMKSCFDPFTVKPTNP